MTSSRGLNVLHCTAELMASSAVHGADAERLGVLRNVLPSSEHGTPLVQSFFFQINGENTNKRIIAVAYIKRNSIYVI